MAVISLNKKSLEKKVGKITPKLKERIDMLGCAIENETAEELMVDISPNRPDLLSEQGVARALLAFIGKKTGLLKYKAEKSKYKLIVEDSVKSVRPYTACAVIKNMKFDSEKIKEIIEMQEKLHMTYGRNRKRIAIGIYPMEKIKFPITYKALAPDKLKFKPLESESEITGTQILSRHHAGKNYGHLLEGKSKFPVFEDAKGKILSMPPIINSEETGRVTEKTKELFIECSGFDMEVLNRCLSIITTALADMGGKIYSITMKYGSKTAVTPDLSPDKMKVNLKAVNKLLGLELKDKELKQYLERMNYSYSSGTVLIPAYRTDVLHEVDLIEDVAIAYGYENFKQEIPHVSTIGKETKMEILKRNIAESLVGMNMLETYSYSITNQEDECTKMNTKEDLIQLTNAKTNYNVMRNKMLPSLMKIFGNNRDVDYPQRIFEIGRVFEKNKGISEKTNLAIALTNSNFTEMRQVLDYLSRMFDVKISIQELKQDSFIEGRTAKVLARGQPIGVIGEIHPQVLSNWKLLVPVSAMELELDKIKDLI